LPVNNHGVPISPKTSPPHPQQAATLLSISAVLANIEYLNYESKCYIFICGSRNFSATHASPFLLTPAESM
jgi:hypothetical protein